MPITDPTDLSAVQHWYVSPTSGSNATTVPDGGPAGDDLVAGSANGFGLLHNHINGQSVFYVRGTFGDADLTFGTPISQPCDIFIVGTTPAFAFISARNLIEPPTAGTGAEIGWVGDGGGGHRGRFHADVGTAVNAPQDGRIIEGQPYVLHLRCDGADSEMRGNGAYWFSGDLGSDAIDGIKLPDPDAGFWYFAEIVITDALLSDLETGQLLEYFNGRYARPDWAPSKRLIGFVVPTNPPDDSDDEAMMRFAVEERGHTVEYIASADFATTDLSPYHLIMYAGPYSDRNTNAPVLRALIDSGVPCWITMYEPGMGAAPTDTVACQLDLISQATLGASFACCGSFSIVAHDITDYAGTPPQSISGHTDGAEHAYLDSGDSSVGTAVWGGGGRFYCIAIDAGTLDLTGSPVNAPVVLNGQHNLASQYYWGA